MHDCGNGTLEDSSLVSEDQRLADERLWNRQKIATDLVASDLIARDAE